MTAPLLRVRGLTKRFGRKTVHQDISFDVNPGEIVAIIGESGSGKSVILRQVIRLLRPSSGKVYLFDRDFWALEDEEDLSRIKNRIGVLFQNGALFSALTVRENVAVPLREQTELPDHAIESVIDLRLLLSGLELDVGRKMPSQLSGGMRKRVALARALALEPEVLLLDEPTSGLDPINARAFDVLVRTLCDNLALTIIIVTHDLDTVEGIADRIIVIGDKRILADGKPADVARSDDPWIRAYFESRISRRKD